MKLVDVEASFLRYIGENLSVSGITVFESVFMQDFTTFQKWVVIDSLSNSLKEQPKQIYFVHCAVQKGAANSKAVLTELLDTVHLLIEKGTRIDIYEVENEGIIGEMEIIDVRLNPLVQHAGGGLLRSFTISIAYAGN